MPRPQPYWWDDDERSGSARALRYMESIFANDYCGLFSNILDAILVHLLLPAQGTLSILQQL